MPEPILSDRRAARRYTLELDVRFRISFRKQVYAHGAGRTLDVSSGGVAFTSNGDVPIGARAELSIAWPVMLNNSVPLTLAIVGRVVRQEYGTVAIKTIRHEFRTQPSRNGAGQGSVPSDPQSTPVQ